MENKSSIFILDTNEISREILKSYIENFDINCEIKTFFDYKEALQEIKIYKGNLLVFADISENSEIHSDVIKEIKLFTPKIVITSTDCSTNTIVKAMRTGAKEFLPKPVLKTDLERVLKTLLNQTTEEDDSASKIISIYSNKGGIGKTTIATNLALEISRITGEKVALIDLNLQLGDISTFLNLNPTFDVAYFIKNLTDKKEENFINAFEKYQDTNLYILSDPNYIEQSESITPQEIEKLFSILKKVFPYIVIDMSSNIDPNTLKILDKSDYILFTTIINMPAIRNAQRCINLFNSRRYSNNKVKIIINRYMENDEINTDDIESTLGQKIYWKIPNNYFSIMESINKGLPVNKINPNSNIAESFKELACKISDEIIEQTISKYRGN